MKYRNKAGWANYNAIQLNYQCLYHHGFACQIFYVYGKQMSIGGDTGDDSQSNGDQVEAPDADYPGVGGTLSQMSPLAGGSTPFAGVAPPARPANLTDWEGYQIAGLGEVVSRVFQPATGNLGPVSGLWRGRRAAHEQ